MQNAKQVKNDTCNYCSNILPVAKTCRQQRFYLVIFASYFVRLDFSYQFRRV